MRGVVWLALALLLFPSSVAAAREMVLTFTPLSGGKICVNETLLVNATNEETGRDISRVQLDFYYGDRKIEYTSTNEDGIALFTPALSGIYRVNAEKRHYRSRELYLSVGTCEAATPEATTSTTTSSTTTSVSTTSTIACLYDIECVTCEGDCIHEDSAPEECKLDISDECECTGGACALAPTTTSTTTTPTTSTFFMPTTSTIPAKEESSDTRVLAAAALALLVFIVIALYAVNTATTPREKPTKLGGKTKKLSKRRGTTRLEKA